MAMDIDSIFADAGDLGRQQMKYLAIINVVHLYLAVNVFQYAIVAKNVDFYCITGGKTASCASLKSLSTLLGSLVTYYLQGLWLSKAFCINIHPPKMNLVA